MTIGARTELFRASRIMAVALLAQPAVASLISSTAVRYPLIGAVILAVEVTYHVATAPVDVVKPAPAAPRVPPAPPPLA